MILSTVIAAVALHVAAAAAHLTRTVPLTVGARNAGVVRSAAPQSAATRSVGFSIGEPLSFDGAQLGMSVAAWKALPPPPGVAAGAAADCGPGIVAALRDQRIGAASPGGGHSTCAYDTRFGPDVLLRSARLDDRYRIEALRYRFTGGRLAEVDFDASIDAYADIVAMLTREYGAPTATVRDTLRTPAGLFPRVRKTWRTAGGVVSLDDPVGFPLRLGVRIASPGASATR